MPCLPSVPQSPRFSGSSPNLWEKQPLRRKAASPQVWGLGWPLGNMLLTRATPPPKKSWAAQIESKGSRRCASAEVT